MTDLHIFADRRWTLSDDAVKILELLAQGESQHEIAKKFGMTYNGFKNALGRLYTHMGAMNQTHAVALAYERGILKCVTSSKRKRKGN